MSTPNKTISKKIAKGAKLRNAHPPPKDALETSPTSVAIASQPKSVRGPSTPSADSVHATPAGKTSTARKVLDFSKIDVRSEVQASIQVINDIGSLTQRARADLQDSEGEDKSRRGETEICLNVAPVRITHGSRGYSFVLLTDHTGYVSICGKSSLFANLTYLPARRAVEPEDERFAWVIPQTEAWTIKVSGLVSYKWSISQYRSETDKEVFFAFKDGIKLVPNRISLGLTSGTSFGAILHVCRDPLTTGLVFPAVIGTVVLVQDGGGEITITIEDQTGYAVVTLQKCHRKDFPELRTGKNVFIDGALDFRVFTLQGVDMVSATIEPNNVQYPHQEFVSNHFRKISSTPTGSFQFPNPILHN